MRNRLMMSVLALAATVPTLAMAQQRAALPRQGSWEYSLGAGALLRDAALRDFLGYGPLDTRFANSSSPSRIMPAATGRIGYNFNSSWGLSAAITGAAGSGTRFWTPSAAVTYTVNLNARTSPFILAGPHLTRIEGINDRVTHTVWGLNAGAGIRHIISRDIALRLEGRLQVEHYHEVPMAKNTVLNPLLTLGLSYFVGGRRGPGAAAACPVCAVSPSQRPDTVRVYVPFFPRTPAPRAPVVLRDTLVLEGINFDFDSSAITPEAAEILNEVAREMLEPRWQNTRWEVAGHTSSIGGPTYNMALSIRRAESVKAYLFSRGVPENRMVARGYGLTQPLVPNDAEGRAWQNRRMEMRRIW